MKFCGRTSCDNFPVDEEKHPANLTPDTLIFQEESGVNNINCEKK